MISSLNFSKYIPKIFQELVMPPLIKERKKQCNMKVGHNSIINHSVTMIIIDTRLQKKAMRYEGRA